MKADQLMVPVYINEKIVLDMLAIIEDGFSTVSQVRYTEHKENSNAQKLEAGVSTSATLLSKLLKIDLGISLTMRVMLIFIHVNLLRRWISLEKQKTWGSKLSIVLDTAI